jgi:hypothetical protein
MASSTYDLDNTLSNVRLLRKKLILIKTIPVQTCMTFVKKKMLSIIINILTQK